MFDLFKVIRYFVFGLFIISNAIVTSVAVWNLSLLEVNPDFFYTARQVDVYLVILATIGLLLIFLILFLEICQKRVFVGKVWFELLWVGSFGFLTLIGASLITSQSWQLCIPNLFPKTSLIGAVVVSPCTSTQVLEAFTWMPAILLLSYTTLLSFLTFVRHKEDSTIWQCYVRDIQWQKVMQSLQSAPSTPTLPAFRSKTPVIHAPKPKRFIPPLLTSCSARNSAFDIEPSQMEDPVAVQWPLAPARAMTQDSAIEDPFYQPSSSSQPVASISFYNSSVAKALKTESGPRRPPPPPAHMSLPTRETQTTSPPPLGDWPRLDATTRPRTKRYPRSVPPAPDMPEPMFAIPHPPRSRFPPAPHTARSHTPVSVDISTPTRPLRLSTKQGRSPGRDRSAGLVAEPRSLPVDRRPPPLDLSKISVYRSRRS